jgi:hypothetical protein
LAPRKMTTPRNIAHGASVFQNAAHFPQLTDLARHEHPLPRQENRHHRHAL